jgi:hypothetical protein
MIQYKDINSLIKEAEQNSISESLVRNKVKKQDSILFDLLDENISSIIKVQDDIIGKKINSKQLDKVFSNRESYTIKKAAFDFIVAGLFYEKSLSFFEHFYIKKITKNDTTYGQYLTDNQIAYIFINMVDQSVFKLTKTVKIIEPIDGTVFDLENTYQNAAKGTFDLEIEGIRVLVDIQFTYGMIILTNTSNENNNQ